LRTTDAERDLALIARVGRAALLLVPGMGVVYFGFNAGAYFPETVALGALVLAAILLIRVSLARDPFHGFGVPLATGAGALAAFALWTLASAAWSHAPARALIEF